MLQKLFIAKKEHIFVKFETDECCNPGVVTAELRDVYRLKDGIYGLKNVIRTRVDGCYHMNASRRHELHFVLDTNAKDRWWWLKPRGNVFTSSSRFPSLDNISFNQTAIFVQRVCEVCMWFFSLPLRQRSFHEVNIKLVIFFSSLFIHL